MIPPIVGSATVFHSLSAQLQGRYNCYGLQYVGFDTDEPFAESIEALAARFAAEILPVTNAPVIHLLGYSLGVWVAYELAKQLEAVGRKVNLVLTDKGPNAIDVETDMDALLEMELEYWTSQGLLPDNARLPLLVKQNYTNMLHYTVSGTISGSILSIEAGRAEAENQEMNKWSNFTVDSSRHYLVPSDHYGIINHPDLLSILIA
jgi:thioesterase domain-containing protein